MDILKFLKQGNVTANPDYNPKTKKGALEPPTLVDFNPGTSSSDQGRNVLAQTLAGNQYDLNQYDIDKYAEYDVYVNPATSQEELDRERAKNQSTWEQGLRMIGQIGNEVTVGTAVGVADLADVIYNAVTGGLTDNDYSSELTKTLEGVKESINEQLAIYRENPNAAWDVGDFAWWASNAPSIASSLTLMVPGVGVTKGLSLLGKGIGSVTKGTRLAKAALKARNAILKTDKARKIGSNLAESASSGLTMRLLENYQEARQTYDEIYDYSLAELANMTDAKRAEFIANNPKYENMSDEDIAKDVANNSADVTFQNDWMNAVFDVWQMYSLKNVWAKALDGRSTARLRRLNKQAAAQFGDEGKAITEAMATQSFWNTTKTKAADLGEDVISGVRAEWTEGIEEAINYISSQEGIYAGKKVFDKNIDPKTINDYIRDPHLWEQAFWGALGGVVFSSVMSKAGEFVNKKLNKDWVSAEKQAEQEILNRSILFTQYKNHLDIIAEGKNPFISMKNEAGEEVHPTVTADEQETLRQIAEQNYIDNLVIEAVNAGNLGLLESFMNDANVAKGLSEKLNLRPEEAAEAQQRFNNRLNEVKDTYNKTINKVNEEGGSFEVGKIIATKYVRALNMKNMYDSLSRWADDNLQKEINNPTNKLSATTVSDAELGVAQYLVDSLRQTIENTKENASLSEGQKNARIAQYNAEIKAITDNYTLTDDPTIKQDRNDAAKLVKRENPTMFGAIHNKINAKKNSTLNNNELDTSSTTIQKQIKYYDNFFNEARKKIIEGAERDLSAMYNKYEIEDVDRVIKGEEVEAISPKDRKTIQDAYAALDISKPENVYLENILQQHKLMARIAKQNNVNDRVEENPEDENEEVSEENEATGDEAEISSAPTGGQQQTVTAESTESTESTEIPEPVGPDSSSPPVEEGIVSDDADATLEPTTPPATITLPEDIGSRQIMMENILNSYIVENNLDIDNVDELNQHAANMVDRLIKTGFESEEAGDVVQQLIDPFNFSSVDDLGKMYRSAMRGIITKDDAHFKALIEDFVNSVDENGVSRGYTINGIKYVSIAQLAAYLHNNTKNKIIYNLLFDSMKEYLFSSTREKDNIRLIDGAQLEDIRNNGTAFTSYLDEFMLQRYERLRENNMNRVNLSNLVSNPESYGEFTKLGSGTELTPVYDSIRNRILLQHNGVTVGYLGVPFVENRGEFYSVNEYWTYRTRISNGVVHSRFKDDLIRTFASDEARQDLLEECLILSIELNNSRGVLTDSITKRLEALYEKLPDYLKTHETSADIAEDGEEINDKAIKAHHIVKLLDYGFKTGVSQEESINRWFNIIYSSHEQAKAIIDGKFKGTIKVDSISYGNLNNSNEGQEFNNVERTVVGYDEDVNAIGVSYNGMHYSNEKEAVSTSVATGTAVMKIQKPNGEFLNANLQFVKISDAGLSKDAKRVANSAVNYIVNLITEFITNPAKTNFATVQQELQQIIANDGLFTDIDMPITINRNISFIVGGNRLFTINSVGNIVINDEAARPYDEGTSKKGNIIIKRRGIESKEIQKLLKDKLVECFKNATFARSAKLINDKTRTEDTTTNKFVTRVGRKTIIAFGEESYEYNSYQDFLVRNNAVKVNLRNTNDINTSGNWKYDPNTTRMSIVYELEDIKNIAEIEEIDSDIDYNKFNETPASYDDFIAKLAQSDLSTALEDFFDDKVTNGYIKELQKLGIIPKTIKLADKLYDSKGNEVNAKYDRKSDTITLSINKIKSVDYGRTVRVILHESLHQKLENVYDKTDAYKKIASVFNQFRDYVANNLTDEQKANAEKYMFGAKYDKLDLRKKDHKEALEEFIVESITSNYLMDLLNNIPDTTKIGTKQSNLFTKLLELIADMFGIKINEDSLLASARDIYSTFTEKGSSPVGDTVVEQSVATSDDSDTVDINFDVTGMDIFDDSDSDIEFSSIDDISVVNIQNLIDSKPTAIRSQFAQMLDNGDISFACM